MKKRFHTAIPFLLFANCFLPTFSFSQNNSLILNGAYVILNGGTPVTNIYMVVDQANTSGIVRPSGGHINSEGQYNFVKWTSGTGIGNYIFPFGVGGTAADYIPFTFNKTTAANSDLSLSTWTTNPQNMPHPNTTNVGAVTNMTGVPDSVNNAIDRFWDIQSPSVTGNLTFSYRGIENTTLAPTDTFKAQHWNGTLWDPQAGPGNPGVTSGIGTVGPINGQNTFSPWVLDRIALKASIASAQNSVCAGQCTGTATVTPLYGVTAYSYSWDNGQTTAVATGLCAGTHTCVVTDIAHASTTVTVNISSNALPVVTANSPVMCAGNTSTLTASGATTYSWSPAAGLSSTTGTSVTATPTTTSSYTVTGTDGNGCKNTATATVTVNALPNIITSAPSYTMCKGGNVGMSVSGANTYTWSPAGSLNNANSSTPTASPIATTVYTVSGTSAAGCVSNSPATATLTVITPSTLTVNANPSSLCTGQTTTLTVSGASTFTWSANAGGSTASSVTVTPGATDTYTVNATGVNGCATNTGTVTVLVGGAIVINIAATQNSICTGQSTTLNGSGASNYTWTPGGQTTGTITVNPSTTTSYSLHGDNGGGCSGNQVITVSVTATPTVLASAATPSICSGTSNTLTATGATNYTWMPGGANTSTVSVSPGTTTSYTLTGTTLGCTNTFVTTVSVTATPSVTANAASTGTVCTGQSIVLSGAGATTYTWMPGSIFTATTSVNPTINTTYTLTGANGVCTNVQTVSVTAIATPTLTPTATASTICSGASTTLSAGGATNYTWMPGSANTNTISVSPNTNTTYTLIGESGGCKDSSTVSVNVTPTPTLTGITATSGTICAGQSTSLSSSGATNYTWTPGGANSSSINVSPVANTTYSVVGNTSGCTSAQQTVAVTVNPTPSVTATPSIDSARCGVPNGIIHAVIANGGTPLYTYQWYNGSTLIPGATKDSLTNAAIGTYSILITDANGCVVSAGVTTFTVPGSAAVIAAITPKLTQGQSPVSVTFTNSTIGALSYNWNFGNGSSSILQNPNVTFTAPGTYTVIMTANNGTCFGFDTAYVIVDVATTIIIPNIFSPNGDGINDEFFIVSTGMRTLNCDIFNRWGQLVYKLLAPDQKWDGIMNNGNKATDGTYFYILNMTGYDGKTYNMQGSFSLIR